MSWIRQVDSLTAGEDLVPAMFFIPLGNGRILVHVLNYIPPTDTRVVSTKANLALLSTIGNNALLGATEVVIEQILKPHAGDKQEIPTIRAPLLNILGAAVAADFAVVFSSQAK